MVHVRQITLHLSQITLHLPHLTLHLSRITLQIRQITLHMLHIMLDLRQERRCPPHRMFRLRRFTLCQNSTNRHRLTSHRWQIFSWIVYPLSRGGVIVCSGSVRNHGRSCHLPLLPRESATGIHESTAGITGGRKPDECQGSQGIAGQRKPVRCMH